MDRLKKFYQKNKAFLLFVMILFTVRSGFADYYLIPSESMLPTLRVGDYVLVDKTAYHLSLPFTGTHLKKTSSPQRGDVVVFWSSEERIRLIKRIIALPGDQVEIQDGIAYVNGEPEHTQKFTQRLSGLTPLPDQAFMIPDGHYFVMGDNRDNSRDSRFFGPVSEDMLIGRAHHIFWSWAGVLETGALPLERFGQPLERP